MISKQQMDMSQGIGFIKRMLPTKLRGWCNEPGLYVQLNDFSGGTQMKAGGKFIAKVHLCLEFNSPSYLNWELKKYKQGDWEALIEPTYQLTCWIHDRYEKGHMELPEAGHKLRWAIVEFRRTGNLELPDYPC